MMRSQEYRGQCGTSDMAITLSDVRFLGEGGHAFSPCICRVLSQSSNCDSVTGLLLVRGRSWTSVQFKVDTLNFAPRLGNKSCTCPIWLEENQFCNQSVLANGYWGRGAQMLDFKLGEVLACARLDEVPIPPTPSFNCQCEQCGARIWVAHSSPIEPVRMCVACSATHDDQIRQAKPH